MNNITQKCYNEECQNKGIYKCSVCKISLYCSKQCQEDDWCIHKKLCVDKYIPEHIPFLQHQNEDDLIIVYSKYEDLLPNSDPKCMGKFVPQWFITDYVNENRGVFIPAGKTIMCTYKEMEEFGMAQINHQLSANIKKVLFHHSERILKVNNMDPFDR